jgi:hypothetical protein
VIDNRPTSVPIWRVTEPSEQAHAPEWMSFHVLKEGQRCPLSLALQRSSYRQLWDGSGYPTRPNAAAVSGIVVHEAAEAVLKELAEAGVSSLMQPTAMKVLKELGGFTKVLESSLGEFFAGQRNNPRFEQFRDDLFRNLHLKLPQMRATLQALLVSHIWAPAASVAETQQKKTSSLTREKSVQRTSLGSGTFVEIDLQDSQAKWRGRVDLLNVDDNGCDITDLKSGVGLEEHKEQLLVYAMLWNKDTDRNPTQVPIRSLQIVYANGAVAVAIPSQTQMQAFRTALIESSELVRSALNAPVVMANPSQANCRYCPVKLLCGPYWNALPSISGDEHLSDNQVRMIEARGDRSWLATITASASFPINQTVIVRNYEGGKTFWHELSVGLSVRLTNGLLSSFDENETPVINLSMMSEALFVE